MARQAEATVSEAVHPVMAALHELYTSCGYLRLRCEIHAEKLKGFSDWESNTKAMRIAEDVLKRSNSEVSDPAHNTHGLQPRRSRRVLSIELLERRDRKRERNRLWMARWRKNNPALARQRGREWDAKHPGKNAEQLREYYRRHRVRHMDKVKRWMGENKDLVRGYMRKSMKRQCDELTDYYVRAKLTRDGMIKRDEWPASLVELKRAQLKLTRLCRKSRTTTN